MRKGHFALLGFGLLATVVAMFAAFGASGLGGLTLAAVTALLFAADLLIIGGFATELSFDSLTVKWFHFIGAGVVLLGMANLVFGTERLLQSGVSAAVVTLAVAGLVIVFVGIDFLRGGVHYDLSTIE
jgi:peptidoglycan/LPS O-acetylase OafA/YrhL